MKKLVLAAFAGLLLAAPLPTLACAEHEAQATPKQTAEKCADCEEKTAEVQKAEKKDCCAAKKASYAKHGLSFTSPVALTEEDLGSGAVTFVSETVENGRAPMYVMLYLVPEDMKSSLGRPELLQTVKATWMATATKGQLVERTLLGRQLAGERQTTTVPSEAVIETFLVDLPDGQTVALGLSYAPSKVGAEQGEAFLQTVSASLAATP